MAIGQWPVAVTGVCVYSTTLTGDLAHCLPSQFQYKHVSNDRHTASILRMNLTWFERPVSQVSKEARQLCSKRTPSSAETPSSVREVELGDAVAMSCFCSCTRRRKNKDVLDHYYYGKYNKTSSETPTPSVAPTPRVRRKFPGGVGSLSHVSSDVSIQKDDDSTCRRSVVLGNNTATSDSDVEDIERTLLSICEQEEERLKNSEILFQLSDESASDSDIVEPDSASRTSQDLEDLLVTADGLQDSSFSEDSDGPEEPTHRFAMRPHGSPDKRYAEYSNEIWQDIQVSLIEAISSKHSSIQERDNPTEDAKPGHADEDGRNHVLGGAVPVPGDTTSVSCDTSLVPGGTTHVLGDAVPMPGDTISVTGDTTHVTGDTARVPGDTMPVLRAGRFEIRAVSDGALRHS